ncbi:phage tail protein [Pasteurella multocida]
MAKQYYSVLTTYGSQQLATAIATRQPLNITHFAVGDGNGQAVTPNVASTALVNEVHRATISAVSRDPRNNKQVIFELTIPEDVGGFHIREMGIFDSQNKLIAYANCPESFKPTLSSGSGKIQVMRMILLVESSDAVTMKVDDTVIFVTRGQLTPQKITAESQNGVDNDGHSHEIESASTTVKGIVQLTDELDLNNSTLALTAKAGKTLAERIRQAIAMFSNYIPNSKKSSAVDSNSEDTVATSKAVKAVADIANAKQSPATTLAGYGITDFVVEHLTTENLNDVTVVGFYSQSLTSRAIIEKNYPVNEAGSLVVKPSAYLLMQEYTTHSTSRIYIRNKTISGAWGKWKLVTSDGLPVGSIVSFPKNITPAGFLKANGTTFNQATYPDLYIANGNSNILPNLHRSDVGMTAYFAVDQIPEAWIAFDSIHDLVNQQNYPELYQYLVAKYGSISSVPLAEDRFIRNAGNGINVGEIQSDEIKKHIHKTPLSHNSNDYQQMSQYYHDVSQVLTAPFVMTLDGSGGTNNVYARQINDLAAEGGEETRPKAIAFKLCIKTKNTFDDVVFWIKAFGDVVNSGTLDASRLAQSLQNKADLNHQHRSGDITDFDQAVNNLINQSLTQNFTHSFTDNGWQKLPSGLIIQWGVKNHDRYPGERQESITFPLAFPRKCLNISTTVLASNTGQGDSTVNIISETRTAFTVGLEGFGGATGHYKGYKWFAIGY